MTLRDLLDRLLQTGAGSRQNTVLIPARAGHPQDMETGGRPDRGVYTAVDVHYLSTGRAQAAAVLAANATFAHVLADRTGDGPKYLPTSQVSSAGANSRRYRRTWAI